MKARRSIVVTGSSSGLGHELCRRLLQRPDPVHLILPVRPGNEALVASELHSIGDNCVEVISCDLMRAADVDKLVQRLESMVEDGRLDGLVLNAGVMADPWQDVVVNHLCNDRVLTTLSGTRARIVLVNSKLHKHATLENLLALPQHSTSRSADYASSKLAQAICLQEYVKRQSQSTVVICTPGFIPTTRLSRHSGRMLAYLSHLLQYLPFARTVEQGAEVLEFCLSEPGLVSGEYVAERLQRDEKLHELAQDAAAQAQVRKWTDEKMLQWNRDAQNDKR